MCTSAKLFPILGSILDKGKENIERKKYEIAAPHSADSFHRLNATRTVCTVRQYFLCFVCMKIPESLQIEASPKVDLFEPSLIVLLQSLPDHESKSSDFL